MIELWMLLRAMTLLRNMSNLRFLLVRDDDGLYVELTDRLQTRGIIPKHMREAIWQKVTLISFVGYRSVDNYILMVQSDRLTQEDLESIMSTVIQPMPNYKREELWLHS